MRDVNAGSGQQVAVARIDPRAVSKECLDAERFKFGELRDRCAAGACACALDRDGCLATMQVNSYGVFLGKFGTGPDLLIAAALEIVQPDPCAHATIWRDAVSISFAVSARVGVNDFRSAT